MLYLIRIRIYNCSESFISLERKSKVHGMTLKESTQISKELVLRLLNGENISVRGIDCLWMKFLIEGQMRIFKPAVIVDYDRIPFTFEHGNVRIMIDRNLHQKIMKIFLQKFIIKTYIRYRISLVSHDNEVNFGK